MSDTPALLFERRTDQFSPARNDHVVATATCCCCCCCCVASTLLMGISLEKECTRALVERAPSEDFPAMIAQRHRSARCLVGLSPFLGFLVFVASCFLLVIPYGRGLLPLAGFVAAPFVTIAIAKRGYAAAGLVPPERFAQRGIVFGISLALELAASFITFGLGGIVLAVIGLIVFAARAVQPPQRSPHITPRVP